MKKYLLILAAIILCGNLAAQDNKQAYKDQQKASKRTREVRMEKAGKDASKEAKKLTKEGWKPMPGKLPLDKQIDKALSMQVELDDEGDLKYIYAVSLATAGSTAAGQMAASAAAREQIASQMGVSLTALLDNRMETNQISVTEAETISEVAQKGKQIFSQDLGRTENILEAYRVLPNKNVEVMVGIAYSQSEARKQMAKAVKKAFEEKNLQSASIDEKLGWK